MSKVNVGRNVTCPEGTSEISRWCKPPVGHEQLIQAPIGAAEMARRPSFRRPCRGSPLFVFVTGGLHHRLISATPPASSVLPALAFVIHTVARLPWCLRNLKPQAL